MSQYPPPPGGIPPPPPPPPPPGGYAPPPGGYTPPPAPVYGQPQPAAEYGGFGIRLVARIIDGLILGIPFGALLVIVGGIATATVSTSVNPDTGVPNSAATGAGVGLVVLLYLGLLVFSILYFVVMWSRGGTIGQRILKLHVVDANTGGNISMGQAVLRYLGLIIAGIPCYLGYLWVLWDPRKQGWHDKIAGTVVTHKV